MTYYNEWEKFMTRLREISSSKWVDKYVDDNYEVMDNKLTLNSDGFACLTDDLEEIIDKYTGTEDWIENNNYFGARSEIRLDLMDLIHSIINKEQD
tara:strand:+ start:2107 stop:2394 length:288 start_codon:yes stop_codon:yes gene_type:complete